MMLLSSTLFSSKSSRPSFINLATSPLSSFSFRQSCLDRRFFPKKKKERETYLLLRIPREKVTTSPPCSASSAPAHSFARPFHLCGRSGKKEKVEEDHLASSRTPPLNEGKLVLRTRVPLFVSLSRSAFSISCFFLAWRGTIGFRWRIFPPPFLSSRDATLVFLFFFLFFYPSLFLPFSISDSPPPTKQGEGDNYRNGLASRPRLLSNPRSLPRFKWLRCAVNGKWDFWGCK